MNKFSFFLALIVLFYFCGCATLPVEEGILSTELPEPERFGIYHKMEKGQTLWRVAKAYDVSLEDIIKTNNIPDVAEIEENQLIFIPGATHVREIVADSIQEEGEIDGFIWPVKGEIVGYFHQKSGPTINKGIDIKVPQGSAVHASRSGTVVFADDLIGYGKTVILAHKGGFHTVYAKNAEVFVKLGDYVRQNTPVARVNHRGRLALAHFQIRKDAIENNPLHYLP